MFSILGYMDGMSFLDVFSGSGMIGIEAASRGAQPVELVEMDKIKKSVILQNIAMIDTPINLNLMPGETYIKQCNKEFDIVHFDPPFPMKGKEKFLEMADQYGIVKKGGTLMMHYPDEESYNDQIGSLRKYDLRKYGRSMLIFYTRD
jgi:16S rRNA (guanine(966)-N(2))-methyltransferase RsmD